MRIATLRLAALIAPLLLLGGVDVLLTAADLTPPDDPLLFHDRTHAQTFSPFVASGAGALEIRSDWVSQGNGLRVTSGEGAGRFVFHPGFRPSRIPTPKPLRELRVFALGGSTTFGLYVGAEAAFPARLEARLQALAPQRDVRVVNLGSAGWASDRVANLVETLLPLEPDLVVVYSGHNEMLKGGLDQGVALASAQRLRARLLRVSSLFAWLNHAVASPLRTREYDSLAEEQTALRVGAVLGFDPTSLPEGQRALPDPAARRRAAQAYRANLERTLAMGAAAGVPVLLVLPISNVVFPPVVSVHAPGFAAHDDFDAAMADARAALERGRYDRALDALSRARALSPDHAQAHYWSAAALVGMGRSDAARRAFQRAADLDARTHRITRDLEEAFVAGARASGRPWVDLRPAFRADLGPATAKALFVDHVHPTARGHDRIAQRLVQPAAELLGLPVPQLSRASGFAAPRRSAPASAAAPAPPASRRSPATPTTR